MENNSEANDFAHYFTTKSSEQAYYSGHSSKTDPNTPIGLWKSMPITKGDVLNVSAHSFFNQDAHSNNNALDVNVFVNNTISTYNLDENGNPIPAPFSLDNLSLGIGLIPSNPNTGNNLPDAGFVLVFYEAGNDTIPVHQERVYVSQKNIWQYLYKNYTATHTGRVEIFCFNTADIPVYFDNLQIELNPTLVVQENHYYPFGMNLAGIEKQGNPEDKFQFQGVEKEVSFGLNWNETLLRGYDLQLGRWHQIDIKASERESPYVGMGNNPILFSDVLGDTVKYANDDIEAYVQEYSEQFIMKKGKLKRNKKYDAEFADKLKILKDSKEVFRFTDDVNKLIDPKSLGEMTVESDGSVFNIVVPEFGKKSNKGLLTKQFGGRASVLFEETFHAFQTTDEGGKKQKKLRKEMVLSQLK